MDNHVEAQLQADPERLQVGDVDLRRLMRDGNQGSPRIGAANEGEGGEEEEEDLDDPDFEAGLDDDNSTDDDVGGSDSDWFEDDDEIGDANWQ